MSNAPLMLSVSGCRGLIGQSLTPDVAARFAAAVGSWMREQAGGGAPTVVVARDSRPSGQMIESAAVAGLMAVGCHVVRLGIVSTPGAAVMAEQLHAAGGLVVTASHNPIIWNGLKPLVKVGDRLQAPPRACADDIIARFRNEGAAGGIAYTDVEQLGDVSHDDRAPAIHSSAVLPHVDAAAIKSRRFKVVVDGVHGAAGDETKMLMTALGCDLVHLYAEPTGRFPHTPEPVKENLTELAERVTKEGAAIGFAQDPDADRLAIVDEQGTYIGEEYTLALCAMHIFERAAGSGVLKGATVAANLSTSRMIDDIAAKHGVTVLRTAVGEANVAAAMQRHQSIVGGEGNGGIIVPAVSYIRDSLIGMALLLEMLATGNEPLSAIVQTFPRYAIVKEKMPVDAELVEQLIPRLTDRFSGCQIDTQDGVRIDWPDKWVHVRPSNTEPIIRLIAEAEDDSAAKALINEVRDALGIK